MAQKRTVSGDRVTGLRFRSGDLMGARYRIEDPLGKGGAGQVFAVEDTLRPGSRLALKALHNVDPKWLTLFKQEFSLLSVSSHPNIVRVFDFGFDRKKKVHFYTAELIEAAALDPESRWSETELTGLMVQLCRALRFLHSRGITHGDIKPANVLFVQGTQTYKLVDFGAAKRTTGDSSNLVSGTYAYMAPETVARGVTDARSDLFSVGKTVLRLAPQAQLSTGISEILSKLTEENPDARYQDASQVIHAVNRLLGTEYELETKETLGAYVTSPTLVGRAELMERVLSDLAEFQTGTNLFTIAGEPGTGKTRFLEAVRRELQLKGVPATMVSCANTDPLEILRQLAFGLLATADKRNKSPILPWVRGEELSWDGEGESSDTFDLVERVVEWIIVRSRKEGHVLLLDDFDAMSDADRSQFSPVVHRLLLDAKTKLRIVQTDEAIDRLGRVYRLPPITSSDIGTYLRFFGVEGHESVVRGIAEKSGGIPLLVEEIVRRWLPRIHDLAKPESAEEIREFVVPSKVHALYQEAVASLSGPPRSLAELLAVSTVPLPISSLSQSNVDKVVSNKLAEVADSFGTPGLAVANPVVRSLLGEALAEKDRKELHGKISEILLSSGLEVGEESIATHLLQSDHPERALPHLERSLQMFHRIHGNRQALRLLRWARPVLLELKETGQADRIRSLAASIYARVGQYADGLIELDHLSSRSTFPQSVIFRRIADLELKQRNISRSVAALKKAETSRKQLPKSEQADEAVRQRSLQQVAALFQGKYDQVESFGRFIEVTSSANLPREKIISKILRGHAARAQKKWEDARKLYDQALKESKKQKYASGVSTAWGSLALYHEARKEYDEAADSYRKAVETAEETSDLVSVATHFGNLGRLQETRGQYGEALRSYERSLEIFERIGNRGEYAVVLYRRGALIHSLVGPDLAEEFLRKALQVAEESGNRSAVAYSHVVLARVEDKGAEEHLSAARRLFEEVEDGGGQAEVALSAFQINAGKEKETPDEDRLDLSQKVRLWEAWAGHPKFRSRFEGEFWTQAEEECEGHPNPEWGARVFAIKAELFHDQGIFVLSAKAANEARQIFEKLAAQLNEQWQEKYLERRFIDRLKELGELSAVVRETVVSSDRASDISIVAGVPGDRMVRLLEWIKKINGQESFKTAADQLVDATIDLTDAERGFLVVQEPPDFRVVTARRMDHLWIREPSQRFSRSIVRDVVEHGGTLREDDVLTSPRWKDQPSVVAAHIVSFVCVPVRTPEGLLGALYLDRTKNVEKFSNTDAILAEALSEQAAVILQRARMIEDNNLQRERIEYLNKQLKVALAKSENQMRQTEAELSTTRELLDLVRREEALSERLSEFVGKSDPMKRLLELLDRSAESKAAVYIHGESGTGKDMVAKALHENSPRREQPYVPVNCSSIPADLFESYFFGHIKGAFTGAVDTRQGFFVVANGGTLFLDEIGELSNDMQAKLLRAVQESKVRPVGSEEEVDVSVRILSSSKVDLEKLVSEGAFREDLFYRLNVIRIDVPSLRDRPEDIPLLVQHFLNLAAEEHGIPAPIVGDDILSILLKHRWSGNVRELKNEIDRIVTLLPKGKKGAQRITADMLSSKVMDVKPAEVATGTLDSAYDQLTTMMIQSAMARHKGNKSQVARSLGITRGGLRKMMRRLGLEGESS